MLHNVVDELKRWRLLGVAQSPLMFCSCLRKLLDGPAVFWRHFQVLAVILVPESQTGGSWVVGTLSHAVDLFWWLCFAGQSGGGSFLSSNCRHPSGFGCFYMEIPIRSQWSHSSFKLKEEKSRRLLTPPLFIGTAEQHGATGGELTVSLFTFTVF